MNLKNKLSFFLQGMMYITLFLWLCIGFLGKKDWRIELLHHFAYHGWIAYTLIGLLFLCLKHWQKSVLLWFISSSLFMGLYFPPRVQKSFTFPTKLLPYQAQKVLFWNVLYSNPKKKEDIEWMKKENPDVIVLVEVTPAWKRIITKEFHRYPFQKIEAKEGSFGMALLSKTKWNRFNIRLVGNYRVPWFDFHLQQNQQTLRFITIHTRPPIHKEFAQSRINDFHILQKIVMEQDLPTVVLGDFNSTPFSPWFHELLQKTKLSWVGNPWFLDATWPDFLGYFGIQIDHVLVKGRVRIFEKKIGGFGGSDHKSIQFFFYLPKKKNP